VYLELGIVHLILRHCTPKLFSPLFFLFPKVFYAAQDAG